MQDCNTLQHAATHCNTLQHVATHTLQCAATRCNTLQNTATHCTALQNTATHCNTLRLTATHCNTLHGTAKHYGTMQHNAHTATHCNTLHSPFLPLISQQKSWCATQEPGISAKELYIPAKSASNFRKRALYSWKRAGHIHVHAPAEVPVGT